MRKCVKTVLKPTKSSIIKDLMKAMTVVRPNITSLSIGAACHWRSIWTLTRRQNYQEQEELMAGVLMLAPRKLWEVIWEVMFWRRGMRMVEKLDDNVREGME